MTIESELIQACQNRRKKVFEFLGDRLLILPGNYLHQKNSDVHYGFRQNSDFHYLCAF